MEQKKQEKNDSAVQTQRLETKTPQIFGEFSKSVLTGHTDYVTSVSFSPDGCTLASGSWDASVFLWRKTTPSLDEEKWVLTHRFASRNPALMASDAFFKGAILSETNRLLLKQRGAHLDRSPSNNANYSPSFWSTPAKIDSTASNVVSSGRNATCINQIRSIKIASNLVEVKRVV